MSLFFFSFCASSSVNVCLYIFPYISILSTLICPAAHCIINSGAYLAQRILFRSRYFNTRVWSRRVSRTRDRTLTVIKARGLNYTTRCARDQIGVAIFCTLPSRHGGGGAAVVVMMVVDRYSRHGRRLWDLSVNRRGIRGHLSEENSDYATTARSAPAGTSSPREEDR